MGKKRNYCVNYKIYSFKAEDDWGCYKNGTYITPNFNKLGYAHKGYKCNDGKYHNMDEHVAKWEYFNGRIPEGMVIDHIIPIRNGGTNKLSNLRCGTQKQNCNNELSIENYKRANSNKCLGFKHSEGTKKKMSEASKGREFSEETRNKLRTAHSRGVIQISTKDGSLIEWQNCMEIHNVLGYNAGAVSNACRGEYSTHKGHEYKESLWFYKN